MFLAQRRLFHEALERRKGDVYAHLMELRQGRTEVFVLGFDRDDLSRLVEDFFGADERLHRSPAILRGQAQLLDLVLETDVVGVKDAYAERAQLAGQKAAQRLDALLGCVDKE